MDSLTLGGILIGFLGDLTPIENAILMVMLPGLLLVMLVFVKLPLARWKT